ncbi:GlcG/HbpS family heme-binding protein [Pseudomonas abieticivorans]|uniref:GlcG/HbpS family heme-binding protein n=1 Tax=Pseudomonas abieticivorans TaxID=2931382 RepID=UPI0020BD4D4E|nr:heme-binding protein [Pseudomonas sp. PIA16]
MLVRTLFISLASAIALPAMAALPQHPDLDLATALKLADASRARCTSAVTVLDRGGNLIVQLRADNVGPHNTDASRRKAYTALSTKSPTRAFAERARNNPEAANLNTLDTLLLLGGGVPLFEGRELVGALGIAGAGGAEQDEACAIKAAQQLNLNTHP